ncbi:uncharacterized protein TRIVIDRAFT_72996 [Trichoderma virens Gv29-8]|uniref:CFEM domain-containing protein n=1 Tax=Hypocrea virens (strain Gv29-8 / FGSC 10586) TaxID=413071 RepID=G9MF07_HYPVG|nr:uncharacterized protein TRIVIDRAFT_72996 [Trichoderma virens Gv29-8]EHK26974.1 hypothetical protein TRIVIDRAFT_72996 [Trichoderma virens Gv29-8]UKZ57426.1 hypothetical protein TrVGV298_011283 [Trichoderma virens]UKZ83139.1 hypothetical protein TrVFT333_010944 [Trichoderma virens FT-333]
MKFTLVLATFAAVVYGQTIDDVPACAVPCIEAAIVAAGCAETDFVCACKNFDAIEAGSINCVVGACGAAVAIGQVLPAVQAICAAQ